jgi:hypothetical protein
MVVVVVCTWDQTTRCLQAVVGPGAGARTGAQADPIEWGRGAVTGTCHHWAHPLARDLIQLGHLAVEGFLGDFLE